MGNNTWLCHLSAWRHLLHTTLLSELPAVPGEAISDAIHYVHSLSAVHMTRNYFHSAIRKVAAHGL
jgi:hypothetical protein